MKSTITNLKSSVDKTANQIKPAVFEKVKLHKNNVNLKSIIQDSEVSGGSSRVVADTQRESAAHTTDKQTNSTKGQRKSTKENSPLPSTDRTINNWTVLSTFFQKVVFSLAFYTEEVNLQTFFMI